ncbi:SAM-dependent methyltransferase [Streptomyces sp. TRM 70351]|uniref:SAM-dependent methyltransferase n=1 Tax=Streptomyces sp. TRM 70351 TaxID=3116552 RepID=UPI002E7AE7EB|nr:SAM-dependent methyltransferase [Streptomyces sp. TRM 70351]MEE1928498.1 SAM-dependent methyltransferase [Streptomyces sp. TRM 70351]
MTDGGSIAGNQSVPVIDSSVPHSARIWNYWLGGKDNYEVDRIAGDQFREAFPGIAANARAFRGFLSRAIHYLAADAGMRQFLDIGTGLPTFDNTHEIAQRAAPASRIVYVDNDPLVLTHARALLSSAPEGATAYLDADLHQPDAILEQAARTLDFDRPVALILSGILGHVMDDGEARGIVARLMAALPSGSHLLVCDGTDTDATLNEAQERHNDGGAVQYRLRSPEGIAAFFTGLDLVEPGVVSCPLWRPAASEMGVPVAVDSYGGVGRKP